MSYFVDGFDPTDRKAVLRWIKEDHDPFDQWGWCINWRFDLNGELWNRGSATPEEQEYRPSPFGADISDDHAEGLAECSTEALEYAASVLWRFDRLLRRAGLDY